MRKWKKNRKFKFNKEEKTRKKTNCQQFSYSKNSFPILNSRSSGSSQRLPAQPNVSSVLVSSEPVNAHFVADFQSEHFRTSHWYQAQVVIAHEDPTTASGKCYEDATLDNLKNALLPQWSNFAYLNNFRLNNRSELEIQLGIAFKDSGKKVNDLNISARISAIKPTHS